MVGVSSPQEASLSCGLSLWPPVHLLAVAGGRSVTNTSLHGGPFLRESWDFVRKGWMWESWPQLRGAPLHVGFWGAVSPECGMTRAG